MKKLKGALNITTADKDLGDAFDLELQERKHKQRLAEKERKYKEEKRAKKEAKRAKERENLLQ